MSVMIKNKIKQTLLLFSFLLVSCEGEEKTIYVDDYLYGCTDVNACNYDSSANIDDDSCFYADENYDCNGVCISLDECGNCEGEFIESINLLGQCYSISTTTSLDLNNQEITVFPDLISQLVNLRSLNLAFNEIVEIPESIGNLVNLEKLILSSNEITTLPNSIGSLINLDTLYLLFNSIDTLPENIGNLTNLSLLDLEWNQISILPDEIVNLNHLKTLNIGNNEIVSLPDSIGKFVHLEKLFFENNNISSLPPSICDIPASCYVVATGNDLCEKYRYSCIDWGFNNMQWGQQDCEDD